MNFKEYFKGKITFIFLNILGAVMSATLLSVLSVDFYAIIFIFIITVVCSSLFYIYDFSIQLNNHLFFLTSLINYNT